MAKIKLPASVRSAAEFFESVIENEHIYTEPEKNTIRHLLGSKNAHLQNMWMHLARFEIDSGLLPDFIYQTLVKPFTEPAGAIRWILKIRKNAGVEISEAELKKIPVRALTVLQYEFTMNEIRQTAERLLNLLDSPSALHRDVAPLTTEAVQEIALEIAPELCKLIAEIDQIPLRLQSPSAIERIDLYPSLIGTKGTKQKHIVYISNCTLTMDQWGMDHGLELAKGFPCPKKMAEYDPAAGGAPYLRNIHYLGLIDVLFEKSIDAHHVGREMERIMQARQKMIGQNSNID